MAGEVTYSGSLSYTKGKAKLSMSGSGKTNGGPNFIQNVQTLTSSILVPFLPLAKGDITTIGWCIIRHMGSVGTILIGTDLLGGVGPLVTSLLPGECTGPMYVNTPDVWVVLGGTALEGDTANVEYLLIDA